jgi:hypothetical protein
MAEKQTKNQDIIEELDGEIDLSEFNFEPIDENLVLEKPAQSLDVISVKREDTRGRLALVFLVGFFVILIIGMFVAIINDGDKIEGVQEVMVTISGVLSGPLGFVVGYYFRSKEEE